MNALLPPNAEVIVATLHPAFAMRGLTQLRGSIRANIARARSYALTGAKPARRFNFIPNPEPDELINAINAAPKFVVDVETPGKHNDREITLVGIATAPDTAYVMSWTEPYRSIIKEALESPKHTKIGHNIAFDAKLFRQYGINLAWPVVDTIQAAALLWPSRPKSKESEKQGKVSARLKLLSLAACVLRTQEDVAYWKDTSDDPRIVAMYKATWPEVPDWQIPYLYCAHDVIYNFRLWTTIREYLVREGLLNLFANIVAPAGVVLHKIEARGILLDVEERDRLRAECKVNIESSRTRIHTILTEMQAQRETRISEAITRIQIQIDETSAGFINGSGECIEHPNYKGLTKRKKCEDCQKVYEGADILRSTIKGLKSRVTKGKAVLKRVKTQYEKLSDDYWRWVLFAGDALRLEPLTVTKKTKKPQVGDEVIEKLRIKYPEIELLQLKVQLSGSKYRLKNRLGVEPEEDGRVHFIISQHRAGTGRFASGSDDADIDKIRKSPGNVQNVPDRDRRIYIAPEGRVLIQADWSQIEARVTAWTANEQRMLEAFMDGKDFHSLNAAAIYGCEPTKEAAKAMLVRFHGDLTTAREAAKHGTHGLDYYMQIIGLMYHFGLPFKEAHRIFWAYHKQWPDLMTWQNRQIDWGAEHGFLTNHFSRKDWYEKFYDQKKGKWTLKEPGRAVAFTPQSDVADMAKILMKRLDELNLFLLTNTHDSFLVEEEESKAQETAALIKREMEREWPELGKRTIRGKELFFVCPSDVAIGYNWGKHHAHTKKCNAPCPLEENLRGLQEIKFT